MTYMRGILPCLVAGAISWAITRRFCSTKVALLFLDHPNHRSSHSVATPRGGGVAIFVAVSVVLPLLAVGGWVEWPIVISICAGGLIVVAVGIVDDYQGVAAKWKFVGQVIAGTVALGALGAFSGKTLFDSTSTLELIAVFAAVLYTVWMQNLTNFMDGIDGIAATETISTCIGCGLLASIAEPSESLWIVPLVLAGATLGFLRWNWAPAKVFLGDAGSGFLGLSFALLSIEAGLVSSRLFLAWVILLGVFIVDATFTLLRRIVRREKFYEAHHDHAYQHATSELGSHAQVAAAVCIINVGWLFPIAYLVTSAKLESVVGVSVAFAPLILAAIRLRAGAKARPN